MKKDVYKISCKKNGVTFIPTIHGYTFTFGGVNFGVSNIYNDGGIERVKSIWTVTELTTGLAVLSRSTRKEAIHAVLHNETSHGTLIGAVKNAVEKYKTAGGEDLNLGIEVYDTFLVAKTYH